MLFKLYHHINYTYNTKVYIILLYIFFYRYSNDTITHYTVLISNCIRILYKKKDLWYYARADIPWCEHCVTLQIASMVGLSNKKIIRRKVCYKFLRLYNVYTMDAH